MSLKINATGHWELATGAELHSGDQVELFKDEQWIQGEIQYHPRRGYQIRLKNGQVFDLCQEITLRILRSDRFRQGQAKPG